MKTTVARAFARQAHAGQSTRSGEPMINHIERVARAVPKGYRALAYLHDVFERSDAAEAARELRGHGLSDHEFAVLMLLTRSPEESYRRYVMRVARGLGPAGHVARIIKLADLDDHLRHRSSRHSLPNYAWAREQILAALRVDERPPAARVSAA